MAKKPKDNDWKDRLNVVYSTNPDFNYEVDDDEEQTTLPPSAAPSRAIGPQEPGRQSRDPHHRICRYGG